MATLFADAAGSIVGIAKTAQEEAARFPSPPTATVSTLRFDETTNANLLAAIFANINSFTLVGSVLSHNGSPVTIAAPGSDYQTQANLANIISTLRAGNATSAQVQTVLAVLLTKLRQQGIL